MLQVNLGNESYHVWFKHTITPYTVPYKKVLKPCKVSELLTFIGKLKSLESSPVKDDALSEKDDLLSEVLNITSEFEKNLHSEMTFNRGCTEVFLSKGELGKERKDLPIICQAEARTHSGDHFVKKVGRDRSFTNLINTFGNTLDKETKSKLIPLLVKAYDKAKEDKTFVVVSAS